MSRSLSGYVTAVRVKQTFDCRNTCSQVAAVQMIQKEQASHAGKHIPLDFSLLRNVLPVLALQNSASPTSCCCCDERYTKGVGRYLDWQLPIEIYTRIHHSHHSSILTFYFMYLFLCLTVLCPYVPDITTASLLSVMHAYILMLICLTSTWRHHHVNLGDWHK